jgi:hypothetical protein
MNNLIAFGLENAKRLPQVTAIAFTSYRSALTAYPHSKLAAHN